MFVSFSNEFSVQILTGGVFESYLCLQFRDEYCVLGFSNKIRVYDFREDIRNECLVILSILLLGILVNYFPIGKDPLSFASLGNRNSLEIDGTENWIIENFFF